MSVAAERIVRLRNIKFVLRLGDPAEVAREIGKRSALIVCDRGYLRVQKAWRQNLATNATCPVVQVESDVIVPVDAASSKQEFAARTLRPKLESLCGQFCELPARGALNRIR